MLLHQVKSLATFTTTLVTQYPISLSPDGSDSSRPIVPTADSPSFRSSPSALYSTTATPTRDPGLQVTAVVSNPRPVPGPHGIPSRTEQIDRLRRSDHTQPYDVLVVGAGATGAGIALDAATRGLTVACVERGDFGSETSSRSSKLIWAGIRYMATATAGLLSKNLLLHPVHTVRDFLGEMKMVLNCHRERRYMLETQSHLCHWQPILVPFTSWYISPPPMGHPLFSFFPILSPIVFFIYDALSAFSCPRFYLLSAARARQVFPQLTHQNLKYAAVFYEAMHNDSRTNLAIALTAAERGAAIANYVECVGLTRDESTDKVNGARVVDRVTGEEFTVAANKVVLAGGPFTDDLRQLEDQTQTPAVRGAAGTHIVVPGYFCPPNMGMLDINTSDGRFLFILPWLGHTLIGTTDKKCPAQTLQNPPEEEIEWIVNESKTYLDVKVRRNDVLSAWRGWRPLAVDPYAPSDAPVSRDHIISENPRTGVTFIAGGKWTTWREMAQEVVDRLTHQPCQTLQVPLHGREGYHNALHIELIQRYSLETDVAEHLVKTYGGRAWDVCELMEPTGLTWPKFGHRLVDGFPYIDAEVKFACREYACTVEDVLSRRTRLAYLNKDAALAALPLVADIMSNELGWSDKVKQAQMDAARRYIASYSGRVAVNAREKLLNQVYTSLEEIFEALDRDENGFIDKTEIAQVAHILGFRISPSQIDAAYAEMDKDGRGRVSVKAFEDWWRNHPDSPLKVHLERDLNVKHLLLREE